MKIEREERSSVSSETTETSYFCRLYVVMGAPNSVKALANLKAIVKTYLHERIEIELVDILEAPERGLADGVLLTPMLVRISPKPMVKIVGDLSRTDRVIAALDLSDDSLEN